MFFFTRPATLTVSQRLQNANGISIWSLSCLFNPPMNHIHPAPVPRSLRVRGRALPERRVWIPRRGKAVSSLWYNRRLCLDVRLDPNRSFPQRKSEDRFVRWSFACRASSASLGARCASVGGAVYLQPDRPAARWSRGRPACRAGVPAATSAVRGPRPGAPVLTGAQVQRRCGNRQLVTVHGHDPRHPPGDEALTDLTLRCDPLVLSDSLALSNRAKRPVVRRHHRQRPNHHFVSFCVTGCIWNSIRRQIHRLRMKTGFDEEPTDSWSRRGGVAGWSSPMWQPQVQSRCAHLLLMNVIRDSSRYFPFKLKLNGCWTSQLIGRPIFFFFFVVLLVTGRGGGG